MGIAIDPTKLAACVTGGAGASVVDRDGTVARDLGVTSTPTVFLNGRRVLPLQSKEELQHLLESEMARTSLASISAKK